MSFLLACSCTSLHCPVSGASLCNFKSSQMRHDVRKAGVHCHLAVALSDRPGSEGQSDQPPGWGAIVLREMTAHADRSSRSAGVRFLGEELDWDRLPTPRGDDRRPVSGCLAGVAVLIAPVSTRFPRYLETVLVQETAVLRCRRRAR